MYLQFFILNNIRTGLTKSDPVANEKKARKKEKERLFWHKLGFFPLSLFDLFLYFVLVIYINIFYLIYIYFNIVFVTFPLFFECFKDNLIFLKISVDNSDFQVTYFRKPLCMFGAL